MREVLRRTEQIDANAEKMNITKLDTRKKLAHVSSQNFQLKQEISKLKAELLKLKKENENLSKTFDDNSDNDLPVLQSSSDTITPGTPLLQSTPNTTLLNPPSTPTNATAENPSETLQD